MKNSKTLLGIGLLGLAALSVGVILIKSDAAIAVDDSVGQSSFSYTGIENKQETVYNIDFSNVSVMEITGGVANILRMFQLPVVVNLNPNPNLDNSNSIANRTISNILGGENMKISRSNNITIIGGTNSEVGDNNHAATLFGGKGNKLFPNLMGNISDIIPSVLLGGSGNYLKNNHNANVIVGGTDNLIDENSTNITILGGNSTSVSGVNLIVGGGRIQGNISNAFVFNDGKEQFDASELLNGVFYFNVENGVRLGRMRSTVKKGVFSEGSVNLGNVKVEYGSCTEGKVGMMGTFQGCILGCTAKSADIEKWELLDNGKDCENICKSNSGICRMNEIGETTEDYHSFCTDGVNTENAEHCENPDNRPYNNVIFQTYIIDSDKSCPNNAINQCIYRCEDGFHLVKDESGKLGGETRCFADCEARGETKKHSEIIEAYDKEEVSCEERDTCEEHKVQLMCVNGEWHRMKLGHVEDAVELDNFYRQCNGVGGSACMNNCSYKGGTVYHGNEVDVYKLESPECPEECKMVHATCYNGTFYSGFYMDGGNVRGIPLNSNFISDSCRVKGNNCDGYDIDEAQYHAGEERGIFTSCIRYGEYGEQCSQGETMYRLESCKNDFYRYGNNCKPCDNSKPENSHYNGDGTEDPAMCLWECDEGYYKEKDYCYPCANEIPESSHYNGAGTEDPSQCAWECDEGFEKIDGVACKKVSD